MSKQEAENRFLGSTEMWICAKLIQITTLKNKPCAKLPTHAAWFAVEKISPWPLAPGPYETVSSWNISLGYELLHLENEGMELNSIRKYLSTPHLTAFWIAKPISNLPLGAAHREERDEIGLVHTRFSVIYASSKITADGDCSHEIKRCLLLGRKVMTNLDSILKSREVTLSTKVHLVRLWFFQWSCMDVLLLLLLSHFSHVRLCATPQTAAHQAPPSLGFSRQEHWHGLPFPSPMQESEKWKWSRSVMSNS